MDTVKNRTTEAVIRENISTGNLEDALTNFAIFINMVGDTPTISNYTINVDFKLAPDGNILWIDSGNQPTVSNTYYVTYDYYPVARLKTIDNVLTDMRSDINVNNPLIDVSEGTVQGDIFLEVPAQEITDLYVLADHVSKIQSLTDPNELTNDELNNYAYNFGITRKPAESAVGQVVFSASSHPGSPILISAGTQVSTPATSTTPSIAFLTTQDVTLPTSGSLSIVAPVQAIIAGSTGEVGANTISIMNTPVTGITSVNNPAGIEGGLDQESNTALVQRILQAFAAINIGTKPGIQQLIMAQTNVEDALTVGAGDPLMVRDYGIGGKVDVYVLAESGISSSAIDTITWSGGSTVVLQNQPVLSIGIVQVNAEPNPRSSSTYHLQSDTGLYKGSYKAQDMLVFDSAPPSSSDTVVVTYTYNSMINTFQTLINLPQNHIVTADVLIREAAEIYVDMIFAISVTPNSIFTNVESAVSTAISLYIDSLMLGQGVKYDEIIDIVYNTIGVANISIPFTLLCAHGGSGAADVLIGSNQYARMGIPTITEI